MRMILGLKVDDVSTKYFTLDKDLKGVESNMMVKDYDKLKIKLQKAIDKYEDFKKENADNAVTKTVVGISDLGAAAVTYFDDGTFSCHFWSTRLHVTGNWS